MNTIKPDVLERINQVKCYLDTTFLNEQVLTWPGNSFVQITDVCNLRCRLCPRQKIPEKIKDGMMTLGVFEKVIRKIESAGLVELYGLGEPLLHPDFFGMLRISKERGLDIQIVTNGTLLTEEVSRHLVEEKLDSIVISLDASKKKLAEKLREGLDFDNLISSIGTLNRIKKDQKSEVPRISFGVVVSRENVWDMIGIVRLAKSLGCSAVNFQNLIVLDSKERGLSVLGTWRLKYFLKLARWVGKRNGLEVNWVVGNPFPWEEQSKPNFDGKRFGCFAAWRTALIERDGTVKPCCYFAKSFGNILEMEAEKVANGEHLRGLRRGLMEGNLAKECVDCGEKFELTESFVEKHLEKAGEILTDLDSSGIPARLYNNLKRHLEQRRERFHGMWGSKT